MKVGIMCPNCSLSQSLNLDDLFKYDYITCPDCRIILIINEDKVK